MAYDVDRKPATWVMGRSARRERILLGSAAATVLVAVAVILAAVAGYRVSTAASIGLLALVIGARPYANRYADRHFRMLDGALAERSVGETLNELQREHWVVMHDIEQQYEGNIDHLVSGPNGVYLVETKLHRYQKSDLVKVMRQAMKLHDELSGFVTPVICLDTRAGRAFRTKGVWIVPHRELLNWLRKQHNRPIPFERLARYADKV
jgi:hypothetical protein